MMNISIEQKKCVFCRFWEGASAERGRMKNYWSVDPSAKGMCMHKRYETRSVNPACNKFELDYKYPKL